VLYYHLFLVLKGCHFPDQTDGKIVLLSDLSNTSTFPNKKTSLYFFVLIFGGLEVACWPLVPKFAGSNPAEAVGFLGRKNPQHAFLRRGSKAVCPMSQICGMKRSLELRGSRILDEICRNISRPRRVTPSAARGLSRRWT